MTPSTMVLLGLGRQRARLTVLVGLLALAETALAGAGPDAVRALALTTPGNPRTAPAFSVASPGGPSIRLTDYRGKVVFLNFWATWCPPCREEMPAMEQLYRRHKDRGLVVLAVSIDVDGAAAVTPFVAEQRFTYPIGLDPQMAVAQTYGVRGLPSSFFVDQQGRLVASAVGPREWDSKDADAFVDSLLKTKR
ncbi:MAG: TlpA disulfide reductase family protein [Candidatus Rokuibacteriota bacterium]